MLDHADSTDDEVLKNLFDNFVDRIVIDNDTVDVTLVVRPSARIAYKTTSGHPQVTQSAIHKR